MRDPGATDTSNKECVIQRTIAGDYQKLVVIREVVHNDIGVCGHDLLLGSKLGALLELEVADRSRQGQVAVHPSEVDEATSGGDSCFLAWRPKIRSQKLMCVCGAARWVVKSLAHLHFGACGQRRAASRGP